MEAFLTPDVMRMFERILVVVGGILAIYLGYRLFHVAQIRDKGEGKFKSAVLEFSISRVGPGVFFALFGAYVLYTSLSNPISISRPPADLTDVFLSQQRSPPSGLFITSSDLAKLQSIIEKLPEAERNEGKKLLADLRQRSRPGLRGPDVFLGYDPGLLNRSRGWQPG